MKLLSLTTLYVASGAAYVVPREGGHYWGPVDVACNFTTLMMDKDANPILSSQCDGADWTTSLMNTISELNLNDCLVNRDGQILPGPYGKFAKSCHNIRLDNKYNGNTIFAECDSYSGTVNSQLYLGPVVVDIDGKLTCADLVDQKEAA